MARATVERASPLWLSVALLAVGGFLAWLYIATSSAKAPVAPVLEEEAADEYAALSLAELKAGTRTIGRDVDLEAARVVERLGRGAFSIQLDSASAYPVLLDRDLIALNTQVYGGDRVRLWGHIFTFNDSIRSEWVKQTAVDAANANRVPRSRSFLLADSIAFVP